MPARRRRRSRSNRRRDKWRYQLYVLRRIERRRLLDEAFWDGQRAETVAMECYEFLGIVRGEVLFDKRGYLNPSLEQL